MPDWSCQKQCCQIGCAGHTDKVSYHWHYKVPQQIDSCTVCVEFLSLKNIYVRIEQISDAIVIIANIIIIIMTSRWQNWNECIALRSLSPMPGIMAHRFINCASFPSPSFKAVILTLNCHVSSATNMSFLQPSHHHLFVAAIICSYELSLGWTWIVARQLIRCASFPSSSYS